MKTILNETRLDLARLFTGVGVEVGVADGWYSRKIMELGQVTKLYGVDPYTAHRGYMDYTRDGTFQRMKQNAHNRLDKYPNHEFIEAYSIDAATMFANDYFDFVYIDADHSYKAVIEDIDIWLKKVKPGGIIAGDDYIRSNRDKQYYDVITAVDDYVKYNNISELFIYAAGRTPSNWMFIK